MYLIFTLSCIYQIIKAIAIMQITLYGFLMKCKSVQLLICGFYFCKKARKCGMFINSEINFVGDS